MRFFSLASLVVAACAAPTTTLGIPFAKPPVGDLRWAAPVDVDDGTPLGKFGLACPQGPSEAVPKDAIGEDCLTLNVFVPASAAAANGTTALPVMHWIYGGSYVSGASSIFLYNGQNLADEHGVIVVTQNYRLGALGFLGDGAFAGKGGELGNFGILDQISGLRWVQKHIAAYGGDPNKVTVFGESAGGASVCVLLVTPKAKGLFRQAIMESGLCQDATTTSQASAQAASFAPLVNCTPGDAACLRAAPWEAVVAAQFKATPATPDTPYAPTIDGAVLVGGTPLHTLEAPEHGDKVNADAVIVGTNTNETSLFDLQQPAQRNLTADDLTQQLGVFFRGNKVALKAAYSLYDYDPSTGSEQAPGTNPPATNAALTLVRMSTDAIFTCPSLRAARALSKSALVFAYVDAYTPLCSYLPQKLLSLLGAFHSSEIQSVFNVRPSATCQRSKAGLALAGRLGAYWTAFAKTGNPSDKWPLYNDVYNSTVGDQSIWFSAAPDDTLVDHFRGDLCAFWDKITP